MSTITAEILFIVLLIVANGVFALAEVSIVASRKARLQQRANEGDAKAGVALELADSPNRFLATVQIGITLVGILAGAFGGATLSKEIASATATVPLLAPYANSIGLAVVVIAITYLSLIIGELVPKRIGLHNPERIASVVAVPMRFLSVAAAPVVSLLSFSTDTVLRLIGLRASTEPPVTEEEIEVMIEQGTQAGVFAEAEQNIVRRVFRLDERTASSLMTRRPDIAWLNTADSFEQNRRKLIKSAYSRLPVCDGDLNRMNGIVRAKDLLAQCLQGEAIDFACALQPPVFVPETLPAIRLFETFKKNRTHIIFVVDEFGSIQGLVTLNDVLEAIVGELPSIDESDDPEAVQRDDGSWLLDGMLAIHNFKEIFGLDNLPDEEAGHYQSLSGLIMAHLGRIPETGERFTLEGFDFEIVDMDGTRIDKVIVKRL